MDGFKSVSDIATNSMELSKLRQLINSKLGETLSATIASRVAAEVSDAILNALGSMSLNSHFAIERAGYSLKPASSNKVILHQDGCESSFVKDGMLAVRRHDPKSIEMAGSPRAEYGKNIILYLPMNRVELDHNKARLLAERLMAFASSGELSLP